MEEGTHFVLKKYWGYSQFRANQEEIVQAIIEKRDLLAILPTGGGKSLCFQLPALLEEGIYLVISPLIALIKDQVEELLEKNINAKFLVSGDTIPNWRQEENLKFIYVSPERLQSQNFINSIRQLNINAIVVDEAHCISQWGHDFRPNYLKISTVYQYFPLAKRLAFTATATEKVRNDILKYLNLRNPYTHIVGVDRENLKYAVLNSDDKIGVLKRILNEEKGAILIYSNTRQSCVDIARIIYKISPSVSFYHAGLSMDERSKRQQLWMNGTLRIMVATNAFGMGINKKDIRLVIHWMAMGSLEAYCQEAGRAGRDQKFCQAIILVSKSDFLKTEKLFDLMNPDEKTIKKVFQTVCDYHKIAVHSQPQLLLPIDIESISKRLKMSNINVFYSLKTLIYLGYIELSEKVQKKSLLMITVSKDKLYHFQVKNSKYDLFIKYLLRSYGGELFFNTVSISESEIANQLKKSTVQVRKELVFLNELGLLSYVQKNDDMKINFLRPRPIISSMFIDKKKLLEKRAGEEEKYQEMKKYIENTTICRQIIMAQYFGFQNTKSCGICDICTQENEQNITPNDVLLLIQKEPMFPKSVLASFKVEDMKLIQSHLSYLLEKNMIKMDDEGRCIYNNTKNGSKDEK